MRQSQTEISKEINEMQEQSLQYIAHLKKTIRYGEELVIRAQPLLNNANPVEKREWEREMERREWQVKYFSEMLQLAEESIEQEAP
jgi:hypothetical protein